MHAIFRLLGINRKSSAVAMSALSMAPPTDTSFDQLARVCVLDFRDGGSGSLIRGLEDLGFSVVLGEPEQHGPVHMVVVSVADVCEDALSAIRGLRSTLAHARTPILVIATEYEEASAKEYLRTGATDFLSQPSCASALRGWCERILHSQREDWLFNQLIRERRRSSAFDRVIVPLGLALFSERDYGRLLEMILLEAKAFCLADGGTLYVRTAEDTLEFTMVHNDTLGISEGGSKGAVTRFPPLRMYHAETGEPEHHYIATHVALTGEAVNLPDVYDTERFDLTGTKKFDLTNGYRTQSVLAMPLTNQYGHVIGVLQIINARDPMTQAVQPFDSFQEETILSLGRLAGSGLESYQRMQALREQIQTLHLEVDEAKKQAQVAQITGSEYFKGLKDKVRVMRDKGRQA